MDMDRLLNQDPDLILGYIEGDLSDEDRRRFEQMRKADAQLDELVEKLAADRQALRDLPDVEAPSEVMERVNQVLERSMLLTTAEEEGASASPVVHRMSFSWWASRVAVAAMLVLTTGLVVYLVAYSMGITETRDIAQDGGEHGGPIVAMGDDDRSDNGIDKLGKDNRSAGRLGREQPFGGDLKGGGASDGAEDRLAEAETETSPGVESHGRTLAMAEHLDLSPKTAEGVRPDVIRDLIEVLRVQQTGRYDRTVLVHRTADADAELAKALRALDAAGMRRDADEAFFRGSSARRQKRSVRRPESNVAADDERRQNDQAGGDAGQAPKGGDAGRKRYGQAGGPADAASKDDAVGDAATAKTDADREVERRATDGGGHDASADGAAPAPMREMMKKEAGAAKSMAHGEKAKSDGAFADGLSVGDVSVRRLGKRGYDAQGGYEISVTLPADEVAALISRLEGRSGASAVGAGRSSASPKRNHGAEPDIATGMAQPRETSNLAAPGEPALVRDQSSSDTKRADEVTGDQPDVERTQPPSTRERGRDAADADRVESFGAARAEEATVAGETRARPAGGGGSGSGQTGVDDAGDASTRNAAPAATAATGAGGARSLAPTDGQEVDATGAPADSAAGRKPVGSKAEEDESADHPSVVDETAPAEAAEEKGKFRSVVGWMTRATRKLARQVGEAFEDVPVEKTAPSPHAPPSAPAAEAYEMVTVRIIIQEDRPVAASKESPPTPASKD